MPLLMSEKPVAGINCAVVSNGTIEENGNSEYRLKINGGTYAKAEAKIEINLQNKILPSFNWYASAAIKQILTGSKFKTKGSFVNAPKYEFEIEGTKLYGTSFSGGLGCAYDINSNFNISLDLNIDAGLTSQFNGNIGASYR